MFDGLSLETSSDPVITTSNPTVGSQDNGDLFSGLDMNMVAPVVNSSDTDISGIGGGSLLAMLNSPDVNK